MRLVFAIIAIIMSLGTFAETTITLTAPADGAVYDTHSPCIKKFLENSDARSEYPTQDRIDSEASANVAGMYVHNAWFTNLLAETGVENKNYKPFTWTLDGTLTGIQVEYSEDSAFTSPIVEKYCADNATQTRPLNLRLATKYWWRVKGKDANGEEVVSDVRSFTTAADAPRIIGLPGFNMRDLGGGTNADGIAVRQGLILRGKCPMARIHAEAGINVQKMTEQSYREFYLDKHHLKTELDFRSASEALEHQTKYDEIDLSTIGVNHIYYPIDPYHLDLPATYPNIVNSVKMLASGTNYPCYFHCAVGSDRTGTFGAIIDGILGRADEWFYDNYELPSFDSGLARLRYSRKGSEMFERLAPRNDGEYLRDRVVQYLLDHGVTRGEIRAIRAAMLELPGGIDTWEFKNAKAVYTESDQTLTLRYDEKDYSGVAGQTELPIGRSSWEHLTNDVRHVVFDSSFKKYRIENCLQWFENFKYLVDVKGLENFDTSLVTTFRSMFASCSDLSWIDFSDHDFSKCTNVGNMFYKCTSLKYADFTDVDTSKVDDFYRMFSGCSSITNIYASTNFVIRESVLTNEVTVSREVFKGCVKLIGGAGTKYSSDAITILYAHIDGGVSNPGYFSVRGAAPITPPVVHTHVWGNWVTNVAPTATTAGERTRTCTAEGCSVPPATQVEVVPATGGEPIDPPVVDPDPPEDDPVVPPGPDATVKAVRYGDTLTFYYDEKDHSGEGKTVYGLSGHPWSDSSADANNSWLKKVVFHGTFKWYKPTSMASWFMRCGALSSISGLENVDATELTSLNSFLYMKGSSNTSLTTLDLSTWSTPKLKDTVNMLQKMSGLKTIYVSERFDVSNVTSSSKMFNRCTKLVGGNGTKYVADSTPEDVSYARVDSESTPGYFTYKAPPVESQPGVIFYLF